MKCIIEKLDHQGRGIAFIDGKITFVENALPGEELEIEILYNDENDNEKEKENLLKEKEKLELSIERRKKLLSNENYVNKAPANVVENDRIQLEKEQSKLNEIISKLN